MVFLLYKKHTLGCVVFGDIGFGTFFAAFRSRHRKNQIVNVKRILMLSVSDDHGQPIDPFEQIHISAGDHDSADTSSIFKHEAPPAT